MVNESTVTKESMEPWCEVLFVDGTNGSTDKWIACTMYWVYGVDGTKDRWYQWCDV